ncbi:MAG: hypothetical protein ACKVQC_02130 [Elusimicrobiota bacterium]
MEILFDIQASPESLWRYPFRRQPRAFHLLLKGLFLVFVVNTTLMGALWFWSARFSNPVLFSEHGRSSLTQEQVHDLMVRESVQPIWNKQIQPELSLFISQILRYIHQNINTNTSMAYSLPGDPRLRYWSVVYDNAIRVMVHIRVGQIEKAKSTMNYLMTNKAIRKVGWFKRKGKWMPRDGWIVNIIDAAEGRSGGRGIEHIAHVGPNAYVGIAALHLYRTTGEMQYLNFARERWSILRDLQNDNPNDPNYGGIRMGPYGNPDNPQEQQLSFKINNPSFYHFYNGEHAADYKALCDLLAQVDITNKSRYEEASQLIHVWDHKIFDPGKNLFFIGTTEKTYYDENIGQTIKPGVIPMHPLDTSALKISAYGVKGLEQFGENGADKIRQAIDDNFKVTVTYTTPDGNKESITGYDFVSHDDRKKLILYIEGGLKGDIKYKQGVGREPLMSDEWSNWVALADLRMADDYKALGQNKNAYKHLFLYKKNALEEATKSAVKSDDLGYVYPYAHPIPYSLNKPVGFGWNTHHIPYSVIGGQARVLGMLRFDPFRIDGGDFSVLSLVDIPDEKLSMSSVQKPTGGIPTEAEEYVQEAWRHVNSANMGGVQTEKRWLRAIYIIDKMFSDHPDWVSIAESQNKMARRSKEKFPLMGMSNLTVRDLEPVYRKYWALYHLGTAEFIRVMSYAALLHIAVEKKDKEKIKLYTIKIRESANNVIQKYTFSQTYDNSGWLWQPVLSLREYGDFDIPPTSARESFRSMSFSQNKP